MFTVATSFTAFIVCFYMGYRAFFKLSTPNDNVLMAKDSYIWSQLAWSSYNLLSILLIIHTASETTREVQLIRLNSLTPFYCNARKFFLLSCMGWQILKGNRTGVLIHKIMNGCVNSKTLKRVSVFRESIENPVIIVLTLFINHFAVHAIFTAITASDTGGYLRSIRIRLDTVLCGELIAILWAPNYISLFVVHLMSFRLMAQLPPT